MALSPHRKEERRRNLVDAAHALIRETGDAGFSMLQLALRAGVSPATPYNLVGSKSELLALVVQDEFARFAAQLNALPSGGPLARLLAAVDLVAAHYAGEPAFYRGLYHALLSTQASDLRGLMTRAGQSLWCTMVAAAQAADELDRSIPAAALTDILLRAIASTTEAWFAEEWDAARFRRELALSARLLVLGLVDPATRNALLEDLSAAG